ncbi:MAG: flavodoxin family protein [Dehalococcoidales bacterium]|nr:flavodoxin family protein [Dehalococcoidales bacterium]
MKKIIGLSCSSKNGNTETLLIAAAMGAAELGVETEIIRAMTLKVQPCTGCNACWKTGKCVHKDDVDWILKKTCLEDAGLIVAVPCYHIRANGYFACIHEKMNHLFDADINILKKTKVGGIIGIGGSGYDAWTSLTLPMVNIFVQHTRVLVDQFQANFCGLEEWNLWMQDKNMTAKHINELRIQDVSYTELFKRWPQKYGKVEVFQKAVERAKQLGRNVAKAMNMPIEKVKYVGENYGVECPVCHSNVVVIPKDLPYVACPVCYVRGEVKFKEGKLRVKWNKKDAVYPRFDCGAVQHHLQWLGQHYGQDSDSLEKIKQIANSIAPYGNFIAPEK